MYPGGHLADIRDVMTEAEAEAIGALRAHDPRGLDLLLPVYEVRATRIARAITGQLDEAKDAASEAFLKAYDHIDQYDPTRPFAPWFIRIVVNQALKTAQRSSRIVTGPGAEEVLEYLHARLDADPAIAIETTELGQIVASALDQLSPKDRAVIVLRYYEDLDERGVAEALGWNLGVVKIRLVRARRRLRDILMVRHEDLRAYLKWETGR